VSGIEVNRWNEIKGKKVNQDIKINSGITIDRIIRNNG
jgi:hypothetical protein